MSNNYDSLLDLDSLPTTDYNVGTTSSVPDIAFAAPALQQQVLSLDIFAHGVPEEISNTDLLNAFGPMDRVVKKEPTLGRLLFDGLATPSPGLVNLMMGIDGQLHPALNMNVVQNSHTSPVVPRPLSPSPPPAARQPTARPRRASTQQRHPRFVHSPSPSPPPPPRSTAGKKSKRRIFLAMGQGLLLDRKTSLGPCRESTSRCRRARTTLRCSDSFRWSCSGRTATPTRLHCKLTKPSSPSRNYSDCVLCDERNCPASTQTTPDIGVLAVWNCWKRRWATSRPRTKRCASNSRTSSDCQPTHNLRYRVPR